MDMTVSSRAFDLGHQKCGKLAEHLSRIGDRWTLPVVVTLREGPSRFNQLRRDVAGISQQMLTRTLRALERDGMVERTVHPTVPPQVVYALTALGNSLGDQALQIGNWIESNIANIENARQSFDARQVD
ncbi:MAG: transcriptional regulator [Novosphingobium sp.]|nr:MAG: transcriptional regulator [Novosphingobium sp.]